MNEELIQRLEASFNAVKPKGEELVETFYGKLFASNPEVRSMFPDEMKDQRNKLLQSLAFVVANLRNPDALTEALHKLGAGHVAYGTAPEHYPVVRDNLLAAMSEIAGDVWTDQLTEDWTAAINTVAEVMLEGAAQAN